MQQEKYKEGAAALEEWFKTAAKPNSAAYYLLAVAYYQQGVSATGKAATDLFAKALVPAKKAVELMEKPNESWLAMLNALYLQREEYKESIPVLQQLIALAPAKKHLLDAVVIDLRPGRGLSERTRYSFRLPTTQGS